MKRCLNVLVVLVAILGLACATMPKAAETKMGPSCAQVAPVKDPNVYAKIDAALDKHGTTVERDNKVATYVRIGAEDDDSIQAFFSRVRNCVTGHVDYELYINFPEQGIMCIRDNNRDAMADEGRLILVTDGKVTGDTKWQPLAAIETGFADAMVQNWAVTIVSLHRAATAGQIEAGKRLLRTRG